MDSVLAIAQQVSLFFSSQSSSSSKNQVLQELRFLDKLPVRSNTRRQNECSNWPLTPPPSPSFWNSSLNLFCKNSEICIYLREFAMTCFGLKMTNLIFLVTTICPPNHPSPSPFSLLYPSYSSSYHFNISPSPFLLICFVHLDHIYSKTQTFLQTIVV